MDISNNEINSKENKYQSHKECLPKFVLNRKYQEWLKQCCYKLSEEDFFPPKDNRTIKSGVLDINGGNTFYEYLKEYIDLAFEEEFYD